MKDVKLRLDYFLSLGLKCVEGDRSGHIANCDSKIASYTVCAFNDRSDPVNKDYFIASFAPRKNTGSQPVGDYVPVIVTFNNGETRHLPKDNLGTWSLGAINPNYTVVTWKPDLDALIKMQVEHDAKLKGEDMQNVYTQEMKDKGITPTNGMLCRVKNEWLFVGTNSYGNWALESCEDGEILVFPPGKVKPIYTLEQKQINEIYSNCVAEGVNVSKTCLSWIQKQGYLAEIVKPLEK